MAAKEVKFHESARHRIVAGARADGNDLALLRLFLRGVRDDDAASRLFFGFDTANKHAVVQRTKLHGYPSKSAMDVA